MKENIHAKIAVLLEAVKGKKPLVHHITNYVTVNDCANIVLAIGASPIMADDIEEVGDIVTLASALVINTGTLNGRTVESMIAAGKRANELGIPVVLDPVGAGATLFRNKTVEKLLSVIKFAVIRGNMSEIKAISGLGSSTKGVDASEQDIIEAENLKYGRSIGEKLSAELNCVVAITGATDIVSNGRKTYFVENGHKMLSAVTGTGCMCTSLIGAYCAVSKDYLEAATAGVLTMGLAGEKAYEKLTEGDIGSGSFRVNLIDCIYGLTGKDIEERGNVHE